MLQRNYRYFFMFISTSTILCLYVFVFSCINLSQKDFWDGISHDYVSDFLIIYCFIAVWFVGGLTAFHFYLICTNQVTFFTSQNAKNILIISDSLFISITCFVLSVQTYSILLLLLSRQLTRTSGTNMIKKGTHTIRDH